MTLAGCGGGSSAAKRSRARVRELAIASARLTRGTFAIAGIGRKHTRSNSAVRPRLRSIVANARHSRDAQVDFDSDLGLFFMVQSDIDGSGHEDLFADASHNVPAGAFVWTAPVWTNGVKDTYPAQIHTDYQVKSGDFSGVHGTIDFVADDPSGDNGTMHVVMTTQQNENVDADFDVIDGKVHGRNKCTLPDGTSWVEIDIELPDGGVSSSIQFDDGSSETLNMDAEGNTTQILTGPDGSQDASGTLGSDGLDSISFDDGTQEDVDVDTADAGDGGGSGGSDDVPPSDGSDKHIRIPTRVPTRK